MRAAPRRTVLNLLKPLLLTALFAALPGVGALAQSGSPGAAARPDRGAAAGSYALSEFEGISLTNGNLNLSIPLASLPPMAGGRLLLTLRAVYNSKLWNVTRREERYQDFTGNPIYVVDTPQLSDRGGWRIGVAGFSIDFRHARDDVDYVVPLQSQDAAERARLNNRNYYKAVLTTPDGSEHDLMPFSATGWYGGTRSYLQGYCETTPLNSGVPMRYYTRDGSYMTAVVNPPGDPVRWTLFAPDGTQVVNYADGSQRIKDTDGNSVRIFTDAAGTHYRDEHTGRELRLEYDPAANGGQGQYRAWYQTVGGDQTPGGGWQHVDVNMGTTRVQGMVYNRKDWNDYGSETGTGIECVRQDELGAYLTVVREIVLPQTEPGQPGRKFTFGYDSDATVEATSQVQWGCQMAQQSFTRTASAGVGELSRMVTPSGAVVDYAYAGFGTQTGPTEFTDPDDLARRVVDFKTVTHDGVAETWDYAVGFQGGGSVTSPDGTVTSEDAYPTNPTFPGMRAGLNGKGGLGYKTSTAGRVVVERHWKLMPFAGANELATGSTLDKVPFNAVVDAEYTTLFEGGQAVRTSAKTYKHDYNGNVIEVKEYDWFDPALVTRDSQTHVPTGVPAGAKLLRTTATSYHNGTGENASSPLVYAHRALATGTPSVINAPKETTAGAAVTRYSYDGQAYGSAPTAGHVTKVARLDDKGDADPNNDTWAATVAAYGAYGNVSSTTDPNDHTTFFHYDDATHAQPTRVVVNPLNGTGVQTTLTTYDPSTGLVTSTTDQNGQTTDISYVNQLTGAPDPFGRPGVVTAPAVTAGGVSQRRKSYTVYEDAARRVRAESDLFAEGDRLLKSRATDDELGRPVLAEQSEDGSTYAVSTRTVYAPGGRVTLQSQPTRGDGSTPDGWTRVTRDELGRVVEAATFGGASQPSPTAAANSIAGWTGNITTSYWANETTAADQKGRARKSVADGLGRLAQVIEAPGVQGYGFVTEYSYDPLGNLLRVEQGGQLRYFLYDLLSRLIRAKNPEQGAFTPDAEGGDFTGRTLTVSGVSNVEWSVGYLYDPAGNLVKRKDARGVVTAYGYDGLNRNTSVVYSGEAGTPTPNVTRAYDGATLGKGRLWKSEAAQTALTTVEAYDAAGRPLSQNRQFRSGAAWGADFRVTYAYNLAGDVGKVTYPSQRSVTYAHDAAGRLSDFNGNLGDGAQRAYSTGIAYDAAGRVRQERFGTQTPVYNKRLYNSRGQLAEVRVSTHSLFGASRQTDWNRGAVINHYGTSGWGASGGGSDNNGNLLAQDLFIPKGDDPEVDGWDLSTTSYDYDALNRLRWAKESRGGVDQWRQGYDYDRWGNRTIDAAGTWLGPLPAAPSPTPTPSELINETQFDGGDLASTNRLYAPGDTALLMEDRRMRYDGAGNLTYDSYTGAGPRAYDGEGRMTSAQFIRDGRTQTAAHTYDADGRRVRRGLGEEGEVWQVYGAGGELLAEYAPAAPPSQPLKEYGYRSGELLVTADAPTRRNVALASAGATATAHNYTPDGVYPGLYFRPTYANDGVRYVSPQGDRYWRDAAVLPTWVQVDFAGAKTIDEVDVFTLADNPAYMTQSDPTAAQTFTQYGATSFEVQYWTGAAWAAVPGGSVSGNNLVWRKVTFPALTTDKVRVRVSAAVDGVARITEVEAWEASRVNFALGSRGGQASASSTTPDTELPGMTFPVTGVIDGDRKGLNWEHNGGWRDGTNNSYPDWAQVEFAGEKTIDALDVFTLQDATSSPSEPTEAMTFTQYGVTAYEVQYWSGSAWVTVPGGSVTGNNKVWRRFIFPAVVTSKVRVLIHNAQAGRSRLVEVEAWGTAAASTTANVRWLVSDHLGTPRMVVDQTGSLAGVTRHDYLPFGEELPGDANWRTAERGYLADRTRQKFTSKERDGETGLDFFLARHYSPAQGRFISPDEFSGGPDELYVSGGGNSARQALPYADATLPQLLNKYQYCLNNPLRYTDEDGHKPQDRLEVEQRRDDRDFCGAQNQPAGVSCSR